MQVEEEQCEEDYIILKKRISEIKKFSEEDTFFV